MIALQQEQEAQTRHDTESATIYEISQGKTKYRKQYIAYDKLERANKTKNATAVTSVIGEQAKKIVSVVAQKLKGGRTEFVANSKYIAKITGKKRRQNLNIIDQINGTAFKVTSHRKYKNQRNCYVFMHLENASKTSERRVQNFAQLESLQTPRTSEKQEPYKNNNTRSIRSSAQAHESNFLQNSISFIPEETIAQKETSKVIPLKYKPICNKRKKNTHQERKARVYTPKFNQYQQPKTLSEHYPLTQEDCLKLQTSSGRPFTLNAMNEILLDISRKPKESTHLFPSKAAFMAYMGKLYRYEGRDAVKTANLGFKILARATKAEVVAYTTQTQREDFMATFEEMAINCPTPENRFKAKIACTLPPMIGYNLLSSIKSVLFSGNRLEIHLANQLNINHHEQVILKEAMAVDAKITALSVCC